LAQTQEPLALYSYDLQLLVFLRLKFCLGYTVVFLQLVGVRVEDLHGNEVLEGLHQVRVAQLVLPLVSLDFLVPLHERSFGVLFEKKDCQQKNCGKLGAEVEKEEQRGQDEVCVKILRRKYRERWEPSCSAGPLD